MMKMIMMKKTNLIVKILDRLPSSKAMGKNHIPTRVPAIACLNSGMNITSPSYHLLFYIYLSFDFEASPESP